jgi:uncharacterized protein (DUF736 family)
MKGLNVLTDAFEDIADIKDESVYEQHKPRKGPYQSTEHATRMLFVHKQDRYITWVVGGKFFLLLHPSELDQEIDLSAYAHLDEEPQLIRIGDFINAYKLDRAKYVANDPKKKRAREDGAFASVAKRPRLPVSASSEAAHEQPADDPVAENKAAHGAAPSLVGPTSAIPIAAAAPIATSSSLPAQSSASAFAAPLGPLMASPVKVEASKPADAAIDKVAIEKAVVDEAAVKEEAVADEAAVEAASATEQEPDHKDKEIERLRVRAEEAEKDKAAAEKRHKDYISRKGKEVNKLKETLSQSMAPEEAAHLKKQYDAAQSVIGAKEFQDFMQSGSALSPKAVYGELIGVVTAAYKQRIDEAKEKGAQYEKDMDEKEKQKSKKKKKSIKETVFQFEDDNLMWLDITDKTATVAYATLTPANSTCSVSFGGQSYSLHRSGSTDSYTQTNTQTNKMRNVRKIEREMADEADEMREKLHNGMLDKDRNEILYGDLSTVELTDEFMTKCRTTTTFALPPDYQVSQEFSELAEAYAQLSDSGYHYVMPSKSAPTHKRAPHFVSHGNGTTDFNSEIWIKPSALATWLSHAHFRGYKHARIVCHGAGMTREKRDEHNKVIEKAKVAYEVMRDHGVGLCMDFAGSQGQAYGPGLYFGLSEHATVGYNSSSGFPPGSFIMGLILTRDADGWQHQSQHTRDYQKYKGGTSGPYGIRQMTEEDIKNYKTINFGSHVPNTDNAMVVHDTPLVLCLGLVHSFDSKHGYGWKMPR